MIDVKTIFSCFSKRRTLEEALYEIRDYLISVDDKLSKFPETNENYFLPAPTIFSGERVDDITNERIRRGESINVDGDIYTLAKLYDEAGLRWYVHTYYDKAHKRTQFKVRGFILSGDHFIRYSSWEFEGLDLFPVKMTLSDGVPDPTTQERIAGGYPILYNDLVYHCNTSFSYGGVKYTQYGGIYYDPNGNQKVNYDFVVFYYDAVDGKYKIYNDLAGEVALDGTLVT